MADNDQSGYERLRSARWRKSAGRLVGFVGICMVAAIGVRLGLWLGNYHPKPPILPRGPQMRIKVIDVGAGSSELITISTGGTLLIDAGPDAPGGDAVAAAVGLKRSIDLILLSSTRARCIGGLPELIEHTRINGPVLLPCSVKEFLKYGGSSADDAIQSMHEHGLKAMPYDQFLVAQQNAHEGPLGADCPLQLAGVPLVSRAVHNISLAVRVEYGESALLYAAGLNAEDERTLLTRDANLVAIYLRYQTAARKIRPCPSYSHSPTPTLR